MLNVRTSFTTSITEGGFIYFFCGSRCRTLHRNIVKEFSSNLPHKERIFKRVRKIFQNRLLTSSCLSLRLSVRLSARNDLALTDRIFFLILYFSIFRKSVDKTQVSLTLRLLMSYIYIWSTYS